MPRRHQHEAHEPLEIDPASVSPLARPAPNEDKRAPGSYRLGLNRAHRDRLSKQDARAALRQCAMPQCEGKPIWSEHRGFLGICYSCAIDVAIHFDKLHEDQVPVTEARLKRAFAARTTAQREAREAEARATTPGWIYYIQVDERIKVGYSADVKQRMRAYPPHAVLLAVHPGTKTLEADLHRQFKNVLAAGREWFHPTTELTDHINQVIAQFGPPDSKHIYKFREGTPQQMRVHKRSRSGPNRRR